MKMKLQSALEFCAVLFMAMALSACATGVNSTQANYQNACADYWGAESAVYMLAKQGILTYPEVVQLGAVDTSISPMCRPGANPATGSVTKITAAIATLTAIEVAHGVKP